MGIKLIEFYIDINRPFSFNKYKYNIRDATSTQPTPYEVPSSLSLSS